MGRVKTTMIKRVSKRLMEEKADMFKKGDFEENKKIVSKLLDVKSKKVRNVIAGCITRLTKDKKPKKTKYNGGESGRKTPARFDKREKAF
jgi:small subunit ribosomal protein S17e